MPRVTFVNEHRVAEVERGRKISDVAKELGIAVCREAFAGTGIGDYTVWVQGAADCLSPPDFIERFLGIRGEKRRANRARILGDCLIFTQAGLADRLRSPRPIAPPPRPSQDATLLKAEDSSGTAAFPYGHPRAVGKGTRPVVARGGTAEDDDSAAPKAAAAPAAKAAAAAAAGAGGAEGAAVDAAAEKAARIAEKKARQAALKARLAGGGDAPKAEGEAAPAEAPAAAAADAPAAAEAPAAAAPAAEAKPAMDPEKAARIAEKKARQAELKARLAAGKPPEGEGGGGGTKE